MRRRVLLGVSWLIATVVSTAVAYQAVALVGRQVTGDERAGGAVPVAAPTVAPAPPTSTGTTPADGTVGATQAFELVGGSVGLRCEGTAIALQWATPAAGYTVEVRHAGPENVDVRFQAGDRESRITANCESGAIAAEPREDDG